MYRDQTMLELLITMHECDPVTKDIKKENTYTYTHTSKQYRT